MKPNSPITTHILDIQRGKPAANVKIVLEFKLSSKTSDNEWDRVAEGATNQDGRVADLLDGSADLRQGIYRLTFDTRSYFEEQGQKAFYPSVSVVFEVQSPEEHYHVPLILSMYGYSTYRGS